MSLYKHLSQTLKAPQSTGHDRITHNSVDIHTSVDVRKTTCVSFVAANPAYEIPPHLYSPSRPHARDIPRRARNKQLSSILGLNLPTRFANTSHLPVHSHIASPRRKHHPMHHHQKTNMNAANASAVASNAINRNDNKSNTNCAAFGTRAHDEKR